MDSKDEGDESGAFITDEQIVETREQALLNQFGVSADNRNWFIKSPGGSRAEDIGTQASASGKEGENKVEFTRRKSSDGESNEGRLLSGMGASAGRIKKTRKSQSGSDAGLDMALELLTSPSKGPTSPRPTPRAEAQQPISPKPAPASSPIRKTSHLSEDAAFKRQLDFQTSDAFNNQMTQVDIVESPADDTLRETNAFLIQGVQHPSVSQVGNFVVPNELESVVEEPMPELEDPIEKTLTIAAPPKVSVQEDVKGGKRGKGRSKGRKETVTSAAVEAKSDPAAAETTSVSAAPVTTTEPSLETLLKEDPATVRVRLEESTTAATIINPELVNLSKLSKKGLTALAKETGVNISDISHDNELMRQRIREASQKEASTIVMGGAPAIISAKALEPSVAPKPKPSPPAASYSPSSQNKRNDVSDVKSHVEDFKETKPLSEAIEKETSGDMNESESSVEEKKAIKLAREWEFKHQLPKDLAMLLFTVNDPKLFGGSTSSIVTNTISDGHIRFKITRSLPSNPDLSTQFVHRRYRDFQALCLRLANVYPNLVLPGLPSGWTAIIKTEEFLQTRSRRLEGYLVTLLRGRPQIWASEDVAAFLLKDSEAFDEMSTRYLSNNGQDLVVPPPTVSSKLGESFSFWMRTAQATLNVATSSGSAPEKVTDDFRGELSSSFEALNSWVDSQSAVQERTETVEELTAAFESFLTLTQSKVQLLDSLRESFVDLVKDDDGSVANQRRTEDTVGLFLRAFNSSSESTFAKELVGEARIIDDETREGPLRSLHQCAASLGGAKDFHSRLSNDTKLLSSKEVESIKKQFSSLRKRTSRTALRVAQRFANISLERASTEVQGLEELKQLFEEYL